MIRIVVGGSAEPSSCHLLARSNPVTFTKIVDFMPVKSVLRLSITCKEIDRLVIMHPVLQKRFLSFYSKIFKQKHKLENSLNISVAPPAPLQDGGFPLVSSMRKLLKRIKITSLSSNELCVSLSKGKWKFSYPIRNSPLTRCFCCQQSNMMTISSIKSEDLEDEVCYMKVACSDCLFTITLPTGLKKCCPNVRSSMRCQGCFEAVCNVCDAGSKNDRYCEKCYAEMREEFYGDEDCLKGFFSADLD